MEPTISKVSYGTLAFDFAALGQEHRGSNAGVRSPIALVLLSDANAMPESQRGQRETWMPR
jgi:hypothetical protein